MSDLTQRPLTELARRDTRSVAARRAEAVGAYLSSLDGRTSRATMEACLRVVVATLRSRMRIEEYPWEEITPDRFEGIRARLLSDKRPGLGATGEWVQLPALGVASVNKHMSAVRRVLWRCRRSGLLTADEYQCIEDIEQLKLNRLPAGREVPSEERARLLKACDTSTIYGIRTAAILSVLYGCGLRRDEVASVTMDRYDGKSFRIVGKGNKEREVPVSRSVRRALDRWLSRRGKGPGPIFLAMTPRHTVYGSREGTRTRGIGGAAIWKVLAAIVQIVELEAKCTPHDFRRTFIGDMLDAGVDLVTVQKIVGHARPETTMRYDRRPARTMRAAVEKLKIPFFA